MATPLRDSQRRAELGEEAQQRLDLCMRGLCDHPAAERDVLCTTCGVSFHCCCAGLVARAAPFVTFTCPGCLLQRGNPGLAWEDAPPRPGRWQP